MHLDSRLWKLALDERLPLFISIFLGLVAGALAVGQAGALSNIVSQVFLGQMRLEQLHVPFLILLSILILRPILSLLGDLQSQDLSQRVKSKLRSQLLERIQQAGPANTSGESTGELVHVFVEGIDSIDAYFSQYLSGLALALLVPLSIFLAVLRIDLLSAIVLLFTGPLIPLFMVLIGNVSRMLTHQHWRTLNRLSAYFLDIIQGLPTLKILGRSRDQIHQISQASEDFRITTMNVLRVTFLSALTLEMAATLSTAVIAVEIGLRLLYGKIAFEQAFFILLLAPEFYQPLRQLGTRFHAGISGAEAAESIFSFLNVSNRNEKEISIVCDAVQPDSPQLQLTEKARGAEAIIYFHQVSLAYQPGRVALQDVSFEIRKGDRLAVVGPSGGGKSTLASLLLRFVQPDQGRIYWAGRPLDEIDIDEWRKKVAWVPQKPYLFNDSIEANIRVGNPSASREDLIRAAQLAQADDFIRSLPEGYATVVGERGVRLSAGEAQRIALARAFLKNAELIILDEATSHLDLENEALLQKAISNLLHERTVLVIAHRLSTIEQADRVLVLDRGSIQQVGSHSELRYQEGFYQKIINPVRWQPEQPQFYNMNEELADGKSTFSTSVSGETPVEPDPLFARRSGWRKGAGFRLFRLALSVWGWGGLAVLTGAITVLSGVSLMGASAYIIAAAALHPSIAVLQVPIVGVRAFGIGRGVFRYLERVISHQTTFKLLTRFRVAFYSALEPLIPARLLTYRSGDLLERIIADIHTLENFFVRALAPPLTAILSLLLVYLYLSSFLPAFGHVLLLFWLIAGVFAPVLGIYWGRKPGKELLLLRSQLKASAVDFIQGIPDLLAYNQNKRAAAQLETISARQIQTQRTISGRLSIQSAVTGLLSGVGMWTVLVIAVPFVSAAAISGEYLAVIALVALTSFEAILPLPLAAQNLSIDLQAASRLFEVIDADPEVEDPSFPLPMPVKIDLQIRKLDFSYPGSSTLLKGISLDLPPGKRLAVVGPSGSGKTTLANLILRLMDVQSGQILLNENDIRNYSQGDVRARIGVVPQQVYLFNLSIRDNILFGYQHAASEAMVLAAQQAAIHEFIESLPEGFDTWVGEQGVQLSAGERQRIAIAWALVKPASVLIMDEATANLDILTEQKILHSILNSSRDRSILMITHRLVGMEEMDEILVLDNGRIIERGSNAELLAAGGVYRRMWELQHNAFL